MFDQAFSARNFRRIFDLENRKGRYLEGRFFSEAAELTDRLKTVARRIRQCHRAIVEQGLPTTESHELAELYEEKRVLRKEKEDVLTRALEDVSSQVAANEFAIGLRVGGVIRGKPVYTTDGTAPAFFCMKQLQRNINKLYKVQQSNRHLIVSQLREFLSDRFPKYVLRTDVSDFYESIPRSGLIQQLTADSLLTPTSTRLLKQLLWEYGKVSGVPDGIPRGIGVSAYLAEFYMRSFDKRIRALPSLVYYARYVDDIVIVYVPEPGGDATGLEGRVEAAFRETALSENPLKKDLIVVDGTSLKTLEYLGYKFVFGAGNIEIELAAKKLRRYKARVKASISRYLACPPEHESRGRKLLVDRLRYLTGNTRLVNNKRHARVGIYFSNSMLSKSSSLRALDEYLKHEAASIFNERLRKRLLRFSFVQGFDSCTYHRFSAGELARIVEAWKYEA